KLRRVELRYSRDAAPAGQQRRPILAGPDPERRHQADAGDDASPIAHDAPMGSPAVRVLLFGLSVRVDVLDRFLHTPNLFGVLVGNLNPEFRFERQHELDGVERVSAEVVYERGIRRHLFFVDALLLHDDALYFVGYRHSVLPFEYVVSAFRRTTRSPAE